MFMFQRVQLDVSFSWLLCGLRLTKVRQQRAILFFLNLRSTHLMYLIDIGQHFKSMIASFNIICSLKMAEEKFLLETLLFEVLSGDIIESLSITLFSYLKGKYLLLQLFNLIPQFIVLFKILTSSFLEVKNLIFEI